MVSSHSSFWKLRWAPHLLVSQYGRLISKVRPQYIWHPSAVLTVGRWHSSHWEMGPVHPLASGRACDFSRSDTIWGYVKKGNIAFAWLSCYARSWNSTSSVRRSKQQHGCSSWEDQLRSQLLASLSLQTCEWASFPIIVAPTVIKSPPFFESSQLRPQTLWSRDKPFLLSPFWILIHTICEQS